MNACPSERAFPEKHATSPERVPPNHVVYAPSPMPQSKKTMFSPVLSSVATAYLSRIASSAMSISAPQSCSSARTALPPDQAQKLSAEIAVGDW